MMVSCARFSGSAACSSLVKLAVNPPADTGTYTAAATLARRRCCHRRSKGEWCDCRGRRDVEAHLVASRYPGLEEQMWTLRWLEKCLGTLNAPCDLIFKRKLLLKRLSRLQQAEARIPEPPSLFFQPYQISVSPLVMAFDWL